LRARTAAGPGFDGTADVEHRAGRGVSRRTNAVLARIPPRGYVHDAPRPSEIVLRTPSDFVITLTLGRGNGYLTYARYLDDMVVLTYDSHRGRRWAARALERIREEAEAIGVSLNTEKTRKVKLTEPGATFAFLGFDFRWQPNPTIQKGYAHTSPRRKKVIQILRKVRNTLRGSRHLSVRDAVVRVNPIVRGWANYFRVGNSSRELDTVRTGVERKVRRFAVKKLKRRGFGWTRWSSTIVYGAWGLYKDYQVRYRGRAKAASVEKDT
jgi:hypothetical protein